ncbi:MAG: rRNA maturation RNase YbeY [Chloroflexi bacterium]|nr:rRNA maturation RNase YbeY [Chloroflexota bacterium]
MAGGDPRSIYRPPWRIDLTVRPGVRILVPGSVLAALVARILEAAGAPAPASLALILSDDAELSLLNEEHMGAEGPTDVLSFPLLAPEAFPPHPGRPGGPRPDAFPRPPGARVHLGDVVVSVERARMQAAIGQGGQTGDVAWDARDELRLLVAHGVLHVCGWDHAEPAEGAAMRALEQELLAAR